MSDPKPEPDFDINTWTPDKPWPKGYYKPRPRLSSFDFTGNGQPANPGQGDFRVFLWALVALVPPFLGLAAVRAASHSHSGLLHFVGASVPAWLLLSVCGLAAPTLLYAVIMQDEKADFRRNLLPGMLKTLVLLAVIAVPLFGRPLLRWGIDGMVHAIQQDAAMRQP